MFVDFEVIVIAQERGKLVFAGAFRDDFYISPRRETGSNLAPVQSSFAALLKFNLVAHRVRRTKPCTELLIKSRIVPSPLVLEAIALVTSWYPCVCVRSTHYEARL